MKHKNTLREIAKFASGLVFADLMSLIWFMASDRLPIDLFGITFTQAHAGIAIVFDIALFFLFAYYAWHRHHQSYTTKEFAFHYVLGIILAIVAIVHLTRVVFGFEFAVGAWAVPLWLSTTGAIVTGILSYTSFALAKK